MTALLTGSTLDWLWTCHKQVSPQADDISAMICANFFGPELLVNFLSSTIILARTIEICENLFLLMADLGQESDETSSTK